MTISLSPAITQLCLRKLALYGSSVLGNDIYYLKEFNDIIISSIGEDVLVNMLKSDVSRNSRILNKIGNNWYLSNGMKRKLEKFDKIIEDTKSSYDVLEDKKLEKKNKGYSNFVSKSSRLPAIKSDFYALFNFLVESTSISNKTIPPEFFKILEHMGNKPMIGMSRDRVAPK